MREQQVSHATKVAFRNARRPRRSKIVMVPAVNSTPEKQTLRAVVVPFTPKPIGWADARKQGRAYGRVLEGLPKYPTPEQMLEMIAITDKIKARRIARAKFPKIERYRRDSKGEWWMNQIADVLDQRKAAGKAGTPRGQRKLIAKAKAQAALEASGGPVKVSDGAGTLPE